MNKNEIGYIIVSQEIINKIKGKKVDRLCVERFLPKPLLNKKDWYSILDIRKIYNKPLYKIKLGKYYAD